MAGRRNALPAGVIADMQPLLKRGHANGWVALGVAAFVAVSLPGFSKARAEGGNGSVKIGVLTSMGGYDADIGGRGSVVAAEMAIADFGGTVLGKKIEFVSADHQSKPDIAFTIARKWFDTEDVDAIMGLSTSPVAIGVQKLAAQKKRITINTTASTDALTNQECTPYGAHWTYDGYSSSKIVAASLAEANSTWYFLTVDNVGGHGLERTLSKFLKEKGARIVGGVRHPLDTADMSSFLLQAQSSGAKYIAMANAGYDLINTIKQAHEFGLTKGSRTFVAIVLFLSDLKALGLEAADALLFGTAFYAEGRPESAQWAKRFFERQKVMPNDVHAGMYSAVSHYLKAVQAAGTDDADAVMAKMRELPVNDIFATNGVLRPDGRMVHDMYVVRAKHPSQSKGPWDLIELVRKVPGDEAFRPLSESGCPLVKAPQ